MKEITINIMGLGYQNKYQALIKIYDDCGLLVAECKTFNGKVSICLKSNRCYKLVVFYSKGQEAYSFYVNSMNTYVFKLSSSINSNSRKTITFLLSDYYYDNLKIEKGSLIFNG